MPINVSSKDLDNLINSCYSINSPTSELGQLGILFNKKFQNGFKEIIVKSNPANTYENSSFEFDFCWIDKIPLADFTDLQVIDFNDNEITQKVELGDMLLIIIDDKLTPSNEIYNSDTRSFIFQAKVGDYEIPQIVPIGRGNEENNSTAKEFYLLSQWPKFDMYKTSGSSVPLHTDINLSSTQDIIKYGWYCVCPNNNNHNWPCRWMCSPAIQSNPCNITFGNALSAFYSNTTCDSYSIGACFDYLRNGESLEKLNGWSKITNEIIRICDNMVLPRVADYKREIRRIVRTNIFVDTYYFMRIIDALESNEKLFSMVEKRYFDDDPIKPEDLNIIFKYLTCKGISLRDIYKFFSFIFSTKKSISKGLYAIYHSQLNSVSEESTDNQKGMLVIKVHRRVKEKKSGH